MRMLSISAAAALGLAAGVSLASAQATNFAPVSGIARAYYGSDVPGYRASRRAADHWAMARGQRWYGPRYRGPRAYWPRRTQGIPPALYHAGDPQFWR